MNCGGLPYSQRSPQDPDSRYETERPDHREARCGQVDDSGENDFAAPPQRSAGRGVGVLRCCMPHAHSDLLFLHGLACVAGRLPRLIVERAGERDVVAERHFQSNLSRWTYWYVAGLCHTVLDDVNTVLLQHAPNLLSFLRIHASNANTALDLAVTVLNNFELKRDALQPKNDFPTQ